MYLDLGSNLGYYKQIDVKMAARAIRHINNNLLCFFWLIEYLFTAISLFDCLAMLSLYCLAMLSLYCSIVLVAALHVE